jgi:hypothetical protein
LVYYQGCRLASFSAIYVFANGKLTDYLDRISVPRQKKGTIEREKLEEENIRDFKKTLNKVTINYVLYHSINYNYKDMSMVQTRSEVMRTR